MIHIISEGQEKRYGVNIVKGSIFNISILLPYWVSGYSLEDHAFNLYWARRVRFFYFRLRLTKRFRVFYGVGFKTCMSKKWSELFATHEQIEDIRRA
jgi:hypothetical protein